MGLTCYLEGLQLGPHSEKQSYPNLIRCFLSVRKLVQIGRWYGLHDPKLFNNQPEQSLLRI